MNHAEAIEADLFPDVDLLDLYRPEADLSLRRVWVLVSGRLLVETAKGDISPLPGTALSRSLAGELGDWSRLDTMVGTALGSKLPESKAITQWRAAEQKRVKAIRDARQRKLKEAAANE